MKENNIQFDPSLFIPQLTIDYVIFTFRQDDLKILALSPKMTDFLILPSGNIFQNEDVEMAAQRNLKERTGIENLYLRQFHVFGKASRRFPGFGEAIKDKINAPSALVEWLQSRFVTIGYYALVEFSQIHPVLDHYADQYTWLSMDESKQLIMDHPEIVAKAREVLIQDLINFQVAANLLPEKFTLPELQKLYEAVLGRKIDRGNFRKKVLKENILEKLEIQKTGGPHRSPYLYRFMEGKGQGYWHGAVKFGF